MGQGLTGRFLCAAPIPIWAGRVEGLLLGPGKDSLTKQGSSLSLISIWKKNTKK